MCRAAEGYVLAKGRPALHAVHVLHDTAAYYAGPSRMLSALARYASGYVALPCVMMYVSVFPFKLERREEKNRALINGYSLLASRTTYNTTDDILAFISSDEYKGYFQTARKVASR